MTFFDRSVSSVQDLSVQETGAATMKVEFVYLLNITSSRSDSYELAGVFLDADKAKSARADLISRGVDEELLSLDAAPIGIVDLGGVDEPYQEAPVH